MVLTAATRQTFQTEAIQNLQEAVELTEINCKISITGVSDHISTERPLCYENRSYSSDDESPFDRETAKTNMFHHDPPSEENQHIYQNTVIPPPPGFNDSEIIDINIYEEFRPESSLGLPEDENNILEEGPAAVPMAEVENIGRLDKMKKSLLEDESLHIVEKFRICKRSFPFRNYIYFASHAIYIEVEGLRFLDISYLIFGTVLLVLGFVNFDKCQMSACLNYFILLYGGSAIFSSTIYMAVTFQHCDVNGLWMILYRSARMFMLVFCLLGFVEVFIHFPPGNIESSLKYCSPILYWTSMYIFTLTLATITVACIPVLVALVWYFM